MQNSFDQQNIMTNPIEGIEGGRFEYDQESDEYYEEKEKSCSETLIKMILYQSNINMKHTKCVFWTTRSLFEIILLFCLISTLVILSQ